MSTIHVCTAPDDIAGEQVWRLSSPDWSTLAWTARPDDRRGASLISDALAATGVRWQHNPAIRLDTNLDLRHLRARMHVARTSALVLGNAHWTTSPSRRVILDLADDAGCDLYLCYTDGEGTTVKGTGILDDAYRNQWTVHPAEEFPLARIDRATPTATEVPKGGFPGSEEAPVPDISTAGFELFRHRCREILDGQALSQVEGWYADAYRAVLELDPADRTALSALAVDQLAQGSRSRAIARLRGMQAAVFLSGQLWTMSIPALDDWRAQGHAPRPTAQDYARLAQLRSPRTAAVASLSGAGLTPKAMIEITREDICGSPGSATEGLPDEALRPLAILEHFTRGRLLGNEVPRVLSRDVKFLSQQFGFPIHLSRGGNHRARHALEPESLDLRHYGRPLR